MLRDVAYQSNTQEFWNSCVQVCDRRDYRLGGSFFDGKGQPGQISAVSTDVTHCGVLICVLQTRAGPLTAAPGRRGGRRGPRRRGT